MDTAESASNVIGVFLKEHMRNCQIHTVTRRNLAYHMEQIIGTLSHKYRNYLTHQNEPSE